MILIIILGMIYIFVLTILYVDKCQENDINYSNYQNALKVIADENPDLAEYLRRKNEI